MRGTGVDYVFTATLSEYLTQRDDHPYRSKRHHYRQRGDHRHLTIAANNGEDVYSDASRLTASITGVSGGGFAR